MIRTIYLVGDTLELAINTETWYTDEDEAREASRTFMPPFKIWAVEVEFDPGHAEEVL